MTSRKTVLLTGGTGFLGSHLLKRFVEEKHEVILLARSSSSTSRIDRLLEKITVYNIDATPLERPFLDHRIDTIVHCAVNHGKNSNHVEMLRTNLVLPLSLLQLAKEHKVSCFINTDTILDKRINTYALSKSQFKEWLAVYQRDLVAVNIALELFYGPNDDEMKFVSYIIRNLLKNVDSIELTKGIQKRDFIYIDDVVEAFMVILNSSGSFEKGFFHYEVGTGRTITIRDFVAIVKKLTGNTQTRFHFGAIPFREYELMESDVNISEMRKLGWSAGVSLEEGLQKTIEFERQRLQCGKS